MPLGESIDDGVINQIKAREALFSAKERTADQLKYLNSRNAWVRVISFVNKGGSPELSENFVLSGVLSSHTGGSSFTQYSGVNFTPGSNSNSFYKTTDDFGTRPRPGITSFSIKSKNSEGTIRIAEIGFVVWNEFDLDKIEQLYLRLGFEVMVEWGHTIYIRSSGDDYGKLEEYVDGDYDKFFDDTVDEETVQNHIKGNDTELGIRRRTDYNAEAFLGYITNFSWSFRQDGGYECSIKVISTGAVIESLLGNVGSSGNPELRIEDSLFNDFENLYRRGGTIWVRDQSAAVPVTLEEAIEDPLRRRTVDREVLIKFNSQVSDYDGPVSFAGYQTIDLSADTTGKLLFKELQTEFGSDNIKNDTPIGVVVNVYDDTPETSLGFDNTPVFLPLRYCLALINIIIKKQSRESSVLFDLKSEERFLTSGNLVVVRPLKTLLLTEPTLTFRDSSTNQVEYIPLYFVRAEEKAREVEYDFKEEKRDDEILNIFVNLEVFKRNIASLIESNTDSNEISLFVLLTNVLEEINESVSYGIDLGIIFDEETRRFKIIDRGNLPGANNESEAREIKISGTSTTVSSLSLTSKVTNKLSNQISIAAQTNPGSYPASVIKYREWNDDLTTRLKRVDIDATDNIVEEEIKTITADQRLEFFEKLINLYQKLNSSIDSNDPDQVNLRERFYISNEWESLYTRSQIITQEGIDFDPNIPKGLIPIELSFTMDGIAGLKSLQCFKIPKRLLPEKYDNDLVGFVINGLDHTIENNRWFTHIRANMYLFRNTELTDKEYPGIILISNHIFTGLNESTAFSRNYFFGVRAGFTRATINYTITS